MFTVLNLRFPSASSSRCLGYEDWELEDDDKPWEHVIVDDDIEIVQHRKPESRQHVRYGAAVVHFAFLLLSLDSVPDFLESVLVLSDCESKITSCVFDLIREVLWKHIINLDDETESNETLDNHGECRRLTHGKDKHKLCAKRRDQLHRAQNDIDHPASLAALGSLHVLQVPKHIKWLLYLGINHDVEQNGADEPDGRGVPVWVDYLLIVPIDEEDGNKHLNREDDEALLEGEALLKRRAALSHVCADGVVVDVVGEGQGLVKLEVLFFDNHR